jgi:hypothetical protein
MKKNGQRKKRRKSESKCFQIFLKKKEKKGTSPRTWPRPRGAVELP